MLILGKYSILNSWFIGSELSTGFMYKNSKKCPLMMKRIINMISILRSYHFQWKEVLNVSKDK